jgi:hypothetical protein
MQHRGEWDIGSACDVGHAGVRVAMLAEQRERGGHDAVGFVIRPERILAGVLQMRIVHEKGLRR